MASKDLICGGVLGERCVVHGALTDLPSGALSSCLTPLQTETLPPVSPRYMASKDLTCGGVLGERCVVHGALTDLPSGAAVIVLNPALNRNPSAQ